MNAIKYGYVAIGYEDFVVKYAKKFPDRTMLTKAEYNEMMWRAGAAVQAAAQKCRADEVLAGTIRRSMLPQLSYEDRASLHARFPERYPKPPRTREKKARKVHEDIPKTQASGFVVARKERATKREAAVVFLGGGCIVCGEKRHAALQIDHIHDDGNVHREIPSGRGQAFYDDVMKQGAGEYQLLCGTCHLVKGDEARKRKRVKREAGE